MKAFAELCSMNDNLTIITFLLNCYQIQIQIHLFQFQNHFAMV